MEIDQSLNLKRDTLFDAVVLYTATFLFAMTIVLATVQVVIRTLDLPFTAPWTEAGARFTLIVATFLGAAVASRNREHIKMSFVLDRLEARMPRLRMAFDLISSLVVIVFVIVAIWATVPAAMTNWYSDLGGVGFVTTGRLYLGIAIGLSLMLVYEVLNLYEDVRRSGLGSSRRKTTGE